MSSVYFIEYPELSKKAINLEVMTTGVRYWYGLTAVADPKSLYSRPVVLNYLMKTFGITERYARQVIQRFDGNLWTVIPTKGHKVPDDVRIHTAEEVAKIYEVSLDGEVLNPVSHLIGNNCRYYSWQTIRRYYQFKSDMPLLRDMLEELSGIPGRTQRDYDRRIGEKRFSHLLLIAQFDTIQEAREALTKGVAAGLYKKCRFLVSQLNVVNHGQSANIIGIFQRLGNSYVSDNYIPSGGKVYVRLGSHRDRSIFLRRKCSVAPAIKLTTSFSEVDLLKLTKPQTCLYSNLLKSVPWLNKPPKRSRVRAFSGECISIYCSLSECYCSKCTATHIPKSSTVEYSTPSV